MLLQRCRPRRDGDTFCGEHADLCRRSADRPRRTLPAGIHARRRRPHADGRSDRPGIRSSRGRRADRDYVSTTSRMRRAPRSRRPKPSPSRAPTTRPVVAAALSNSAHEGDASFSRNLLDGASDADHGETATLSVVHLTMPSIGGTASTTLPPASRSALDGHTLTVDSDRSGIRLSAGRREDRDHRVLRRQGRAGRHGCADRNHHHHHGTNDAPIDRRRDGSARPRPSWWSLQPPRDRAGRRG